MTTEIATVTDQPPPPAPVPPAEEERWLLPLDPTEGPPIWWCPWDVTTDEGAALVTHCLGKADHATNEVLNQPFELQALLLHRVELKDQETGELVPLIRTVLVRPDGTTLAACSVGLYMGARVICALKGKGPWSPALLVAVKQQPTRLGRRTYTLELLGRPAAGPAPEEAPNGRKRR